MSRGVGRQRGGAPDTERVASELEAETGLSAAEAHAYLELLEKGSLPISSKEGPARRLLEKGMAIVSGDGSAVIPVHPRLGVANQYRTWRETMVREINDKRMRVDKLILELIPAYEAAMEKRTGRRGG